VEIAPEANAGNNSITLPNSSGSLLLEDTNGNLNISGIITATSFSGDASQLSGLTKVLTIGTRTGIVTFSFTTSSFNISGRTGNIAINV
jgi:hypothetical protein